jgi:gamma-glutamylcyclotransferase (GGCT)/AIG2-like uncharacterized protein YtfP
MGVFWAVWANICARIHRLGATRNTPGLLEVFVYGTLKRGFWNHDRFCRGVVTVEDAVVRSRLFETSSGIPVLEVPEADILAVATASPLADGGHTGARRGSHVQSRATPSGRLPKNGTGAPWGSAYGELLAFDDPATRLPSIDRLEGFHPGASCHYRRVLVAVRTKGTLLPAWLYVADTTGYRVLSRFHPASGTPEIRSDQTADFSCFSLANDITYAIIFA